MISYKPPSIQNNTDPVLLLDSRINFLSKLLPLAFYLILIFLTVKVQPSLAQQQKIDSLNAILKKSKIDTNFVNILNEIAFKYKDLYKYAIADSIAQIALTNSQSLKYNHGILRSNLNLAEIQYETLNYSKSLEIYKKLHQLSLLFKNKKYVGICYHRMAEIFEDQGKYEESLKYNLMALEIRKEIKDKWGISSSLGNIASSYLRKSDFTRALDYYFDALKIEIELNDIEVGYTYHNIGLLYFNIKNYKEALKYYELSKSLVLKTNDLRAYAVIVGSIGDVFCKLGNSDMAMKNYREAKEVAVKINDELTIASSYSGIGKVLQVQKRNDEALENYTSALILSEKLDNKVGIMQASLNIGETNIKLGKLSVAKKYINKGLLLNKNLGFKEHFKGAYYNLFEIDSIQNNWKSAFQNFKMFVLFRDSLIKESNSKSIDSIRLDYEYANKALIEKTGHDKETALIVQKKKNERILLTSIIGGLLLIFGLGFLNFKNKKKREQAVLLQTISETDMKALRSQMNPHFIFNCIHTINGLLNELKIQESKSCLDKFSNLTRSVLENSKKREIPLSDELETLQLYMDLENMRFARPFQYSIVIGSGIDPETTLVPPLILQPFVENSIKHGFRDSKKSGILKIEIRAENDILICTVEDNGVGRNNTINLKPVSGFKKESLGVRLTEERLDLISKTKKAKSWFSIKDLVDEANNPTGTLVEMVLPFELSV